MIKLKEIITEAAIIDLATANLREKRYVLLPETLKIVGEEFFGRDLSSYTNEVVRVFERNDEQALEEIIHQMQNG